MSKVLLVTEGKDKSLYNISGIVQRYGYTLIIARDGLAALNLIDQFNMDAIIFDLDTAGISSSEFLSRLSIVAPYVPVIVLSSRPDHCFMSPQVSAVINKNSSSYTFWEQFESAWILSFLYSKEWWPRSPGREVAGAGKLYDMPEAIAS